MASLRVRIGGLSGSTLVTASWDRTARVWNALIGKLGGHLSRVASAVFSPDGQRVLTASEDDTAAVHKLMIWQELDRLLEPK